MSSDNTYNFDNDGDDTKTIVVEDFKNPTNKWKTLNDPVMGGQSYSKVEIDTASGVAKFSGKCAIVPSLQAPGFITMETGSNFGEKPASFPDVSTCSAFQIVLKTNVEYSGYRFSFGKAHAKGGRFAYGYKVPLPEEEFPPVGEFGPIILPFNRFSDKWNDATGDIETECVDDPAYCPTQKWLQRMETISFWGEGVEGMVDLEVKSISAIGCSQSASEAAVVPSMIASKIHTVNSNPFYMISFVTMIILLCVIGTCCYVCCNCRRHGRRGRNNKTVQGVRSPGSSSTYKDSVSIDNEFKDEFDDNDIELS